MNNDIKGFFDNVIYDENKTKISIIKHDLLTYEYLVYRNTNWLFTYKPNENRILFWSTKFDIHDLTSLLNWIFHYDNVNEKGGIENERLQTENTKTNTTSIKSD